jgi:hypothetical protein
MEQIDRETPFADVQWEFTPKAKAFINLWDSSEQEVKNRILSELIGDYEMEFAEDFFFHTVFLPGGRDSESRAFVSMPKDRGDHTVIAVDVAVYESMGIMDQGPFEGKEVKMPMPASEDDNDC